MNNKPFQTSRRAAALSFSGILVAIFSLAMTVIMLPLWAIAFVIELPGEILKLISKINHWRLNGLDITDVDDNQDMFDRRIEYVNGEKRESYTLRISTDKPPKRRERQCDN